MLFLLYLSQMMIPSQLTLIPRFVIFSAVGLVNTHWALILPKVVAVSATFMMRQAFLGTSEELREAAKIDGASEFRIFYQIMVPITNSHHCSGMYHTVCKFLEQLHGSPDLYQ